MEDLRKALRVLSEDDSASALLKRSTLFLQQFVREHSFRAEQCSRTNKGECPLDTCTSGISEVMAELDRVGQMLNVVDSNLGKASHHAESSSGSQDV